MAEGEAEAEQEAGAEGTATEVAEETQRPSAVKTTQAPERERRAP